MAPVETGILYCNENLDRLAEMPSESVDLIYLDPPFFSNKVYEVIWGDEAEVRSFEDRWEGGIRHYIGWMRERLIEMHRVLRPTGSLYLHCDPHASHYLKVMLDEVFGSERFLNEIIWKRTSAHNRLVRFGPVHDVILFYARGDTWQWNQQHMPYEEEYVERFYRHVEPETGRRYQLDNVTSNRPGGRYLWKGQAPPGNRYWGYAEETMERFEGEGRLVYPKSSGVPRYKRYLDEMPGQLLQDVWTDIRPIGARSRERLGYPTQKPENLLERIVRASSREEDIVLDPFCGCGTTIAVAERLKRRWIGIDISPTAIEIMRRRLLKHGCTPTIQDTPETVDALKRLKPFEFQNWIINAVHGKQSPKRVGDMGIDGFWFFTNDPIQVKQSEKIGRNVVDNFETAIRRAGYTTGYVIAFSFGRGAVEEAARAKEEEGLDIRLVKVAEVLLLRKRPHGKLGPQPADISELPLPAARTPKDLPSAEELVASDQQAVG